MDLTKLVAHPANIRIYSPQDLGDLEQSLEAHGLLEPLAITKNHILISGHRRLAAMRNLGWIECEVRFVEPENPIIALIEHNRHRIKTASDILNEARYLGEELQKLVGRGRNAAKKRQGRRIKTIDEVARRLGLGTTRLKQLQSISNYEPDLVKEIDEGRISIGAAYEQVRQNHLLPKSKKKKSAPGEPTDKFDENFRQLLLADKPPLDRINKILRRTYPYCLEITGIDAERRGQLIDHLEGLKKLDSRQLMLRQKFDELAHRETDKADLKRARSLLPTHEEIEKWWHKGVAANVKNEEYGLFDDVEVIEAGTKDFPNSLWTTIRVHASSMEMSEGPGRGIRGLVGFNNKNGFRILGFFSLHSDSHTLGPRDDHIGWTTSQRAAKREHLVNLNVCIATQPFGYNRLGGKFVSLIQTELVKIWEKKYDIKIVAITTTSLHGQGSMYDGMKKFWTPLGVTSGTMLMSPERDEWAFWREWFATNYPDQYDEIQGRTSPKQGLLSAIYKILDIPHKDYQHNHRRGVYVLPLYHNWREFLCGEVKEEDLEPKLLDWKDWWHLAARKRFEKLTKSNKVQTDTLFIEKIDELDIESWFNAAGVG